VWGTPSANADRAMRTGIEARGQGLAMTKMADAGDRAGTMWGQHGITDRQILNLRFASYCLNPRSFQKTTRIIRVAVARRLMGSG
jgi:hypothetical protein